jgi:dihydroorotate dehydrogenase (fumarate)
VITDPRVPGIAVEDDIIRAVTELKHTLRIPIAVKLSPFFTAFANMTMRLDAAGADGLIVFNRFYQPDIDIAALAATPVLELSNSAELRLRLRWLAILHGRVRASLALTGGVESWNDAVKGILAGAHAVQMVSALLRHGPSFLPIVLEKLVAWMEWHQCASLDEMRGRVSLINSPDPSSFERANYIRTLHRWGV